MSLLLVGCFLYFTAKVERQDFLKTLPAPSILVGHVDRRNIFSSVVALFNRAGVENQFPLRITFKDERGVDAGGLYRDMLSAFWEEAYLHLFDGGSLLAPVLHPHVDLGVLPVIGKVLSHGYLSDGFLPLKIAFPTLARLLLRYCQISDELLVAAFLQTVSLVEANLLNSVLHTSEELCSSDQTKLISLLGRFGSRQLPTRKNLKQQIVQVARYEFLTKPSAALQAISSGIPPLQVRFWASLSVSDFHHVYVALGASPQRLLEILREPDVMDTNQERVLGYLRQFIGNMRATEVSRFVRFVTGSTVCPAGTIAVTFNSEGGAGRRPVAHTCSNSLELPSTYQTYGEFESEFQAVLTLRVGI